MADQASEKLRPLVPHATPKEAREKVEGLEKDILEYASSIVREGYVSLPGSEVMGENLQAIRNLIRDKVFDYFKRRLDQHDIKTIRDEHRDKAKQFDVGDPVGRAEIQRLDRERQEKIMAIIEHEFDANSLYDEIHIRFPEGASRPELLREFVKLRDMRIEDLLEAHANRKYTVSDEELERLKSALQPLPMFNGEVLWQGDDSSTFTLVQLTNAHHLALEGMALQHCIAEEGTNYTKDIGTRFPDGNMAAACFSIRRHAPGVDPASDPGESFWTIWYDRESRTIQQVKGWHNAVLRSVENDPRGGRALLRGLARLLTDPEVSKRYPVDNIKDLEGIKLKKDQLLTVNNSGNIETKPYKDISDHDIVLSGSIALDRSFSDAEIQRVVKMRGVRPDILALPEEKRRTYVDAVLQESRRDLATRHLNLWSPSSDLFSRYRFREVLVCSGDVTFAMRICLSLWQDVSKINDADADALREIITDPNKVHISLHLLRFADSRIKSLDDTFIGPVIQSACKSISPNSLAEYVNDMHGTALKGLGVRNIELLADTLAGAPDSKPSFTALSHFKPAILRAFGKGNIRKFVDAVIRGNDHAAIRELCNNIIQYKRESSIGDANVRLLREAGHTEP